MYTGTTEQPCALCGDPETTARQELPPRTLQLMHNGDPVAWRDVVGDVTLFLCESDWELVRDLAVDYGMHPLSRCNAARASFSLRADFEAFVNATRDEQDHDAVEREHLARADEVLAARDDDPMIETRDVVEAIVVRRALEELGVADERETVVGDE
jgi:hypothetical protein